jgi:ribonuclease HII
MRYTLRREQDQLMRLGLNCLQKHMQPPLEITDPMWSLEHQHWLKGWVRIAGIDEAGRGALAGPVAVAAVILPPDGEPRAYCDSKALTASARAELAEQIKTEAIAYAIELASSEDVDEFNVLGATHRAALRALSRLEPVPDALVTDYLKLRTNLPLLAPPKADSSSYSVAAASILAKTTRDAYMLELHEKHPEYGFDSHKGYGAAKHLQALEKFGALLEHRRSFAPVALVTDGLFK